MPYSIACSVAPGARNRTNGSANINPTAPTMQEIKKMSFSVKVNTCDASSRFFSPSKIEIRADAPVAIKLAKPNTIIMIGIMRLTAASASSPINRPTNNPSAI